MKKYDEKPIFSKNLIRIRKQKGLSQIDLANSTGFSKRMIAYYETNAVNPPLDKVEILAKVLNVNINELLGTNEESQVQKDLSNIDSRTIKKIKAILSLPRHQRNIIYSMVDTFIKQNQDNFR